MANRGLKRSILALALVLAMAGDTGAQGQVDLDAIDQAWSEPTIDSFASNKPVDFTPPPESNIPDNAFGLMVKRGIALFIDTPGEAKPYAHDGLSCANCHLDRGRRAGATPMWAAWVRYPQFRSKNERVNTIALRIQGCFRFSMNGAPPPDDSEIMTALQSYLFWLAQGAPTGVRLRGAGYPTLLPPSEAPSIARGAAVFAADCAACHGGDGQGRRAEGMARYQFPPLWGSNSFNWGAGMESVETAARFIKANMPWGLSDALSDQQAWDVAMFMDSHERPQDPRFTGNLAQTRARYHDSKWSLYGTRQGGVMLGDPANWP
jgi:thiosulfate dehydrogenase